MKIRNLGPNQTEVEAGNLTILVSYSTPVAYCDNGKGFFRTEEHFSPTTTRHINRWLDGRTATTVPQSTLDDLLG